MPTQAAVEFVVHPPLCNVRVRRSDDGQVIAIAQIQTQRGKITLTATADESWLRGLLEKLATVRLGDSAPASAASGAVSSWARDRAGPISRAHVVSRLADQARALASSPQRARGLGLSTVVVPASAQTVLAFRGASELLAGMRRKDPRFVTSYGRLAAQAKLGNVRALRSVHILHAVANVPRIISQ